MRLAANLSMLYPDRPFAERFAAARADGFAGVEVLFPYDLPAEQLRRLRQDHGLALALINTPLGSNGERGLAAIPGQQRRFREAFGQALEVAGTAGCRAIHVMAGVPEPDMPADECAATLLDNLRAAAALAAPVGITLTLEALNRHDVPGYFYHRPAQVRDIIQRLAHPGVRLQFDLYHTLREGLDPSAEFEAVRPYVHHVQVAGPPERHEPDLADERLFAALRAIAASGYAGWLGCEYNPRGDTSAGLAWRAPLLPYLDRTGVTA